MAKHSASRSRTAAFSRALTQALPRLCALLLLAAVPVHAEEYFLDGAQKKELLMQGRITGRDGAAYDIWIVPGYRLPWRQVDQGWSAARRDLADYGRPAYYSDMLDSSGDVMRFARRDVLANFALTGTRTSWQNVTATARERVQRRVFGWWFAWPWAAIEGSAQSVVRVGGGIPGSMLIWAGGAVITPAGFLAYPAVMSSAHALGQGALLPLAAASWNTVIAPPLALAGQQPAPERADGWWMKRLADPAEADIRARLADWQRAWQAAPVLAATQSAINEADARHKAATDALRAELAAAEASWQREREALSAGYQQELLARALTALPALRQAMAAQGYTLVRLQAQRDALRSELVAQGLEPALAERVLATWLDGMAGAGVPQRQPDSKTDPLRQVLENIPPN